MQEVTWISSPGPAHGKSSADKLKITIPSSVKGNAVVRVDKRGDAIAERIYNSNTGAYVKLAKDFQAIANDCTRALAASNLNSTELKKDLRKAKLITEKQAEACRNRRGDIERKYAKSKDIYNAIER